MNAVEIFFRDFGREPVNIEAGLVLYSFQGDFLVLNLYSMPKLSAIAPYQVSIFSAHAIRSVRIFDK